MPRAIDGYKVCNKCKKRKPVSEFSRSRRQLDGFCYRCKVCFSSYQKVRRKAIKLRNSSEGAQVAEFKVCCGCGESKPTSEFTKCSSRFDGLQDWCKICRKAHYEENRERIRAYQKEYGATEKGKRAMRHGSRQYRARKLGAVGSYTYTEFVELCEVHNFRCQGCGDIFSLHMLTEDHMTPLSRGGSNNIDNVQPLCKSCNSSKGAMTKEEWILSYAGVVA